MAAMGGEKDPRVERIISSAGWPEDVRASLTAAKGSIDTVIKHWDRLEEGERKAFVLLAAGALAELAKRLSSAAESRDLV